jgi:hypothetical protein
MTTRYLPLVGILSSICLFIVAAASYPGGTIESADSVGYDWTRHFISTLFARTALNGAANPSRMVAIPAMLILCTSIAFLFKSVSMRSPSKGLRTTIEIGGIGSMVYAFLAVTTPMHDLLVSVALLFFVAAVLATSRMLYVAGETKAAVSGMICLTLLAVCAVIYYGNVLWFVLPIAQKLTFVLNTGWLLVLHLAEVKPRATSEAYRR